MVIGFWRYFEGFCWVLKFEFEKTVVVTLKLHNFMLSELVSELSDWLGHCLVNSIIIEY